MRKMAHSARLVLPCRARHPRDAILLGDTLFVYKYRGELSRLLIPLESVRRDRIQFDVAAEVAREVDEVGSLLHNGAAVL